MTRKILQCWLVIVCSIVVFRPAIGGEDAEDIIKRLQKKYEAIRDASVTFTETVRFGVTQSEQSFTGTFLMKRGNKYRIELEQETIVTDGSTVWSYSKFNNQVLVDRYKDDPKSISPDRVLVNVPENYYATLLGKEMVKAHETHALKLVPKDGKSNVKWIKVWVDQDELLMRKMQYLDVSDNLTTYEIGEIKTNLSLGDGQFRFESPKNAEVIDLR